MIQLEAEGLKKSFGEVHAVKSVSLKVFSGEIFGFLGPNGAGKTTTLKILTGFLKPDAGVVKVRGLDPFSSPMEVKHQVGVVPEKMQLYDRLSAEELLLFAARMHGLSPDVAQTRAENLLRQFDLYERKDSFLMNYSAGMKKKAALMMSLLHQPSVLFLDEPFTGMDALSVIRVREMLIRLKEQGVTIFFSSHILEVVEKLCDRIGILVKGELLCTGTKEELKQQYNSDSLENVFLKIQEAGC
jgi:ABC-2 type transport system ATP-binding protein